MYNIGTIRKILLCNFDFQMPGVHCSFTGLWIFIYFGEIQRWLKCSDCQEKNIFQPGFFVIIHINYHGTAWNGLFLTFIKVARMVKTKLGFTG